jgi:hypothetical protein
VELDIIGHMFDPNFSGDWDSVDAIEASIAILNQTALGNGQTTLTTSIRGRVLTNSNDGWSFDTRLVFELVSRNGFLRILKITEVEQTLRSSVPEGVEATSWGRLKSLYHTPQIQTNLTDPAAVISAHAKALRLKNYAAYEALLDAEFEFFPLDRDADDFPWLPGNSWPRTVEIEIIAHMFDPDFYGQENPVDAIEATMAILAQRPVGDGRIEITTTMRGSVLTSSNDGWSFDTRLVFEVIPRNGFLRILKITEIEQTRSVGVRVDPTSWGQIKNLYR